MTRPLRIEFAGALYHVTSRGDRSAAVYLDDVDRLAWLSIVERVCRRFNFIVHAFCQMGNHYHLLMETVDANLSGGMRLLNSAYAQHFNRRHMLVGHLFQGRYHAILVQKEAYLLELGRYLVLNPVRANLVKTPVEWPWSSYRHMLGGAETLEWLNTDWLLSQFSPIRSTAVSAYTKFVSEGIGLDSPLLKVSHQLILGDAAFVEQYRVLASDAPLNDICRAQRRSAALTLDEYRRQYTGRDEAMARAYFSTVFTMGQIGAFFNVSLRTVSRAVQTFERAGKWRDAGSDPSKSTK